MLAHRRELRRHPDAFNAEAAAAWLMVRHADDHAPLADLQQFADEDGLSWPDDGEIEEYDAPPLAAP